MTRRWLPAMAALLTVAGCSGGGEEALDTPAPTTIATTTTTTAAPSTTAATTVPATTTPPRERCVVTVQGGDSLGAIAADAGVSLEELQLENGFAPDVVIHPDDELDICIGNDIDDVSGTSRLAPEPAAVKRQQRELNDLLDNYSIGELAVDGDSGDLTRQAICIARMGLGFPVHNGHLPKGGDEERAIFDATELAIPEGAPVWTEKWALIDKTCQVLITGEADTGIVDVFPTSTGEAGYETFDIQADAFRFDPALDNGGWHDSSAFPVSVDNELNGNMYKPIYFNNGQAIHGANYVPPFPRSKGCARTFPWHHDRILAWLGVDAMTEATWNRADIGLAVVVQGRYVDR